jgi:hypothetical protein
MFTWWTTSRSEASGVGGRREEGRKDVVCRSKLDDPTRKERPPPHFLKFYEGACIDTEYAVGNSSRLKTGLSSSFKVRLYLPECC